MRTVFSESGQNPEIPLDISQNLAYNVKANVVLKASWMEPDASEGGKNNV